MHGILTFTRNLNIFQAMPDSISFKTIWCNIFVCSVSANQTNEEFHWQTNNFDWQQVRLNAISWDRWNLFFHTQVKRILPLWAMEQSFRFAWLMIRVRFVYHFWKTGWSHQSLFTKAKVFNSVKRFKLIGSKWFRDYEFWLWENYGQFCLMATSVDTCIDQNLITNNNLIDSNMKEKYKKKPQFE